MLWKSILQRRLKGGGFGRSKSPDLQLSPFLPWDRDRNYAGGRQTNVSDLLIELDRQRVLEDFEVRVVPSGVLITRGIITSAYITRAYMFKNSRWELIFHYAARGIPITGTLGTNRGVTLHPGLAENAKEWRLDKDAQDWEYIKKGRKGTHSPCSRYRPAPDGRGGDTR